MSTRSHKYEYYTKEQFQDLVSIEINRQMMNIANYHEDVLTLSSFDAGIKFQLRELGKDHLITNCDRFFRQNNSSPDLVFDFSNGYRLIAERKRTWNSANASKCIAQLLRYKQLAIVVQKRAVPAQSRKSIDEHSEIIYGDVVLIVGNGDDEKAVEDLNTDSQLRKSSIVVFESQIEGFKVINKTVRFSWRKCGGLNGKFRVPNVDNSESPADLNEILIGRESKFIARCDEAALKEAGECPFTNDDPPPYYTICHIFFPVINSTLTVEERDNLATDQEIVRQIRFVDLLAAAMARYERVPSGRMSEWLRSAVRTLTTLGVVQRKFLGKDEILHVKIAPHNEKLEIEKVVKRLSVISVRSKAVVYAVNKRTQQLSFEFEDS